MRLVDLIGPDPALSRFADLPVVGLSADSRNVGPGFLFAAIPGTQLDGRAFVEQALAGHLTRPRSAVLASLLADGKGGVEIDGTTYSEYGLTPSDWRAYVSARAFF